MGEGGDVEETTGWVEVVGRLRSKEEEEDEQEDENDELNEGKRAVEEAWVRWRER